MKCDSGYIELDEEHNRVEHDADAVYNVVVRREGKVVEEMSLCSDCFEWLIVETVRTNVEAGNSIEITEANP